MQLKGILPERTNIFALMSILFYRISHAYQLGGVYSPVLELANCFTVEPVTETLVGFAIGAIPCQSIAFIIEDPVEESGRCFESSKWISLTVTSYILCSEAIDLLKSWTIYKDGESEPIEMPADNANSMSKWEIPSNTLTAGSYTVKFTAEILGKLIIGCTLSDSCQLSGYIFVKCHSFHSFFKIYAIFI